MIRIAIIGCGAVTEKFHLPAVAGGEGAEVSVLVDRNLERARELGREFGVSRMVDNAAEALEDFDAAIVALPHFLHAPVSCELLQAGKHVLVEKPMAITSAECDAMLAAEESGGATLTVGQMRRFTPAVSLAKEILDRKWLGEITRVDVREGGVFSWPVVSDFQFRKEAAGGGVLFDTGAHTLDMLIWWLGTPSVTAYRDDNFGGVEADCEIELGFEGGLGAFVELSRTRNLRGTARIEGSEGSMEVSFGTNEVFLKGVDPRSDLRSRIGTPVEDFGGLPSFWPYLFRAQLRDWCQSITTGTPPRASGGDARRTVDCISGCYAARQPLELPWMSLQAE